MYFTGIKWSNDNKMPYLSYKKTLDSAITYKIFDVSELITIVVNKDKYCMGHFSHPSYNIFPCPYKNRLTDTSLKQCGNCRSVDSTYFMPLEILSFEQINILKNQPHLNYINIFGADIIKIGVAAKVRKFTRVLEQGSFATIFFTECDGFVARQLEEYISKSLKIKQSVTWESKLKTLNHIPMQKILHASLMNVLDDITNIISNFHLKYLLPIPEFSLNYDKYHINTQNKFKKINYIDKITSNDVLTGKNIGLFGEIMILSHKEQIFAVNTKSLIGYDVDISSDEKCFITKKESKCINFNQKTVQTSLF